MKTVCAVKPFEYTLTLSANPPHGWDHDECTYLNGVLDTMNKRKSCKRKREESTDKHENTQRKRGESSDVKHESFQNEVRERPRPQITIKYSAKLKQMTIVKSHVLRSVGKGLFAACDIRCGAFVCEYGG